ncbi:MAG: glutathione S-transferase family protein [Gaiellaceae bacterium]
MTKDADGKSNNIFAAQFEGDRLWDPSWKEASGEATIRQRSKTDNADVILYTSWFCPFAQRAWIALEESNANYKYVEINPYEVDPNEAGGYTKQSLSLDVKRSLYPDFVKASPRGLVPGLDHKGKAVWESLHVAEYVDAVFNDEQLIPRNDPHKNALILIWSDHCTDKIEKWYYTALMAQDAAKEREALHPFFLQNVEHWPMQWTSVDHFFWEGHFAWSM